MMQPEKMPPIKETLPDLGSIDMEAFYRDHPERRPVEPFKLPPGVKISFAPDLLLKLKRQAEEEGRA